MTPSDATDSVAGDRSISDGPHDEGGDPACWAHLFEEGVDSEHARRVASTAAQYRLSEEQFDR